MKEKILEQIHKELKLATRIDLVTMIIAVAVTLIFFAVAGGAAKASVGSMMPDINLGGMFGGSAAPAVANNDFNVAPAIIFFVTLAVIAFINWGAINMILKNKAQRAKLNEGIIKLLKDETVDQYNDGTIYKTYEMRYRLFAMIIGSVAALSIVVPLVIFVNQLVTQL
jgi:uncharacterized membrane protein